MAKTVRLSAEQIDQIAQIMRAGLGLALLGVGWGLIGVYQAGDYSADAVLAALGIKGILKDVFSSYILGDYVTPVNLLRASLGLSLTAAIFIFAGFWVRFYGALFAFLYLVPWLTGLYEALPWIFFASDFQALGGPVAGAGSLALIMLFAVLANIGPGSNSIDHKFHLPGLIPKNLKWDTVGVQIRLGLSFLFLGAAVSDLVFGLPTYSTHPYLTLAAGIMIFLGLAPRFSGALALATIGWHLWVNLALVTAIGPALGIFLAQAPFIAAAVIFLLAGGGERLKPKIRLTRTMWGRVD
ncbi:MAG: hypothetical protein IIC07_00800 [Proteobacteria bacterium]|nr:hypothetical protein [Pseudomonadota bacterium]